MPMLSTPVAEHMNEPIDYKTLHADHNARALQNSQNKALCVIHVLYEPLGRFLWNTCFITELSFCLRHVS